MRYEKGSFITVPNKVAMRRLSLGARAVFIEICDMSDDEGVCFPARSTIATRIKMSIDSVDRFIEELVTENFIEKSRRKTPNGDYTSNQYQILLVEVAAPMPLPSRTHAPTGSRTHAALTVSNVIKPTELSSYAVAPEEVTVSEDGETTKKKERTNLQGWATFLEAYPKREDIARASAQWRKMSEEERALALTDVLDRNENNLWPEYKFISLPKTYLEGKRWEDKPMAKVEKIMSFGKNK